jgi:hypothetical protein
VINARATDSASNTATDSNNFDVDNVDEPPTVSVVTPSEGGTVSGSVTVQIDAEDVEDATGTLNVEWNIDGGAWQPTTYNSGSGYYEANWDSNSVENGSHVINARATDSASNTAMDSNNFTVDNAVSVTMHVGDLDGSSRWVFGSWVWSATVTVTVHDANHNPVADATVEGTWTGGFSGSGSCTTGSDGQCSISTGNIWRGQASTTFSVDNLTHATFTYLAADNHDPDGDSDGTSITVNRP